MISAVFGVSYALKFLVVSQVVAMAEPKQDQPIEPAEPERYLTETERIWMQLLKFLMFHVLCFFELCSFL